MTQQAFQEFSNKTKMVEEHEPENPKVEEEGSEEEEEEEEESEEEGEETGAGRGGKQSRSEKKSRKAVQKLVSPEKEGLGWWVGGKTAHDRAGGNGTEASAGLWMVHDLCSVAASRLAQSGRKSTVSCTHLRHSDAFFHRA
jgi:hypothetical protein